MVRSWTGTPTIPPEALVVFAHSCHAYAKCLRPVPSASFAIHYSLILSLDAVSLRYGPGMNINSYNQQFDSLQIYRPGLKQFLSLRDFRAMNATWPGVKRSDRGANPIQWFRTHGALHPRPPYAFDGLVLGHKRGLSRTFSRVWTPVFMILPICSA